MRNSISAVVVSFDDPLRLKECVQSLFNQVDMIVIVDNGNGCGLDEIAALPICFGKIHLIRNKHNRGLAAALNQGIRYSLDNAYTWTLLLDQDSVASEDMTLKMIRSYENLDDKTRKETAVLVPTVFDRKFREMLPSIIMTNFLNSKLRKPTHDSFVHFHITSGSLIKNETLPDIGLMNEYFFIDYIDFDYCFRVLNKGYKILLSRDALLSHALGARTQRLGLYFREHDAGRIYYQTRNRLFVLLKYGKKYKSFLYSETFRSIGKLFKIIVLESQKRQKLRMYFRGIRDLVREYDKLDVKF
jgi:rhamnosyltransferase